MKRVSRRDAEEAQGEDAVNATRLSVYFAGRAALPHAPASLHSLHSLHSLLPPRLCAKPFLL